MDFAAHPLLQLLPLAAVGFVAGFLNVLAGGGSLLTLPLLLWLGYPAPVANASNRIGLVVQNVAASTAFHRGGVLDLGAVLRVLIPAVPGAALGAWIAIDVDEVTFRRILVAILLFSLWSLLRGGLGTERVEAPGRMRKILFYTSFFFMGIYAGFVQAGLGFLLIGVLTSLGGFDLVRTNAIKVALVLAVQILALAIFSAAGKVDWLAGAGLAIGTSGGAWVAAHWQMAKGAVWVRRVVIGLLAAITLRLIYEGFFA